MSCLSFSSVSRGALLGSFKRQSHLGATALGSEWSNKLAFHYRRLGVSPRPWVCFPKSFQKPGRARGCVFYNSLLTFVVIKLLNIEKTNVVKLSGKVTKELNLAAD